MKTFIFNKRNTVDIEDDLLILNRGKILQQAVEIKKINAMDISGGVITLYKSKEDLYNKHNPLCMISFNTGKDFVKAKEFASYLSDYHDKLLSKVKPINKEKSIKSIIKELDSLRKLLKDELITNTEFNKLKSDLLSLLNEDNQESSQSSESFDVSQEDIGY